MRAKPEAIFTFESAFEALPAYRADLFFDEAGEVLDVDLFDPASWERYGWSIYSHGPAKRIRKKGGEELFGTPGQRRDHLARNLERSRRLQALLMRDVPGFPETRLSAHSRISSVATTVGAEKDMRLAGVSRDVFHTSFPDFASSRPIP